MKAHWARLAILTAVATLFWQSPAHGKGEKGSRTVSVQPFEGRNSEPLRKAVAAALRGRGFTVLTSVPDVDDAAQYPALAREHTVTAFVTGELPERRKGRSARQTVNLVVLDGATGSALGRWSPAAAPKRLPSVVARGLAKKLGRALDAAKAPPPAAPEKAPTPPNAAAAPATAAAPAANPPPDAPAADKALSDLKKQVGENQRSILTGQTALNIVWTLVCGFLVMFMQAGFALIETGLTRAKNMAHTMGMNFLVYSIGIIAYWAFGFALQMGGIGALSTFGSDTTLSNEFVVTLGGKDFGLFGMRGFFLSPEVFTGPVAALFLFQMVFMDTTATVPTGAMAERWKFSSFVVFSLVISSLTYPIFGNWVWGGGWLSQLGHNFGLGHGHVDFAGSSVVHMVGGVAAFVGAKMLGPRLGKYDAEGNAIPIPGHNMAMAVLGTFILAFGWFGFNAGSTLAGSDTRIAVIAVNTMLASAAGAFSSYAYLKVRYGAPDLGMMCNGMLAGMVSITAPCAFVTAPIAMFIGSISGVLVVLSAAFVENKLKVDDPASAISVHATNGAWGILALGLFADGRYGEGWNGVPGPVRGLFYGDASQLLASIIGIVVCVLWTSTVTFVSFRLTDKVIGNRVSAHDEAIGLDVPELAVQGYGVDAPTPE